MCICRRSAALHQPRSAWMYTAAALAPTHLADELRLQVDSYVPREVTLLRESFLAVRARDHAVLMIVLHVPVQLDLGTCDVFAVATAERLGGGMSLAVNWGQRTRFSVTGNSHRGRRSGLRVYLSQRDFFSRIKRKVRGKLALQLFK